MAREILLPGDLIVPVGWGDGSPRACVWSTSITEQAETFRPPKVLEWNDTAIVISVKQNHMSDHTVEAYVVTSRGFVGHVLGQHVRKVETRT